MSDSSIFRAVAHCFLTVSLVVVDLVRLAFLAARSHRSLAAENLFLRKQLALLQERKARPRRANDATRWLMATLSQMFQWQDALVNVKPDTLIRWHRKGFRLFWRWQSKPTGRPLLPKNLQLLIREMGVENPTWGEERQRVTAKTGDPGFASHGGEVLAERRPEAPTRSQTAVADVHP
jgi:putative transposase